jgi:hypothetical protein
MAPLRPLLSKGQQQELVIPLASARSVGGQVLGSERLKIKAESRGHRRKQLLTGGTVVSMFGDELRPGVLVGDTRFNVALKRLRVRGDGEGGKMVPAVDPVGEEGAEGGEAIRRCEQFSRILPACHHRDADIEVTGRIESLIRVSDVAARFGGDELALLLPDTDANSARVLVQRIQAAMTAPVEFAPGRTVEVTLSIGLAAAQPTRADVDYKDMAEHLLAEADAALYRAKSAGRNRLAVAGDTDPDFSR